MTIRQSKSALIFAISTLFIANFMLVSCEPGAVPDEVVIATEQDVDDIISDGKLYTISEFIDTYMSVKGNAHSDQYPEGNDATNNVYLFKLDTLPTEGDGIYIRGRVATDDYNSNFYKELVLQQIVSRLCLLPREER